MYNLAAQSHVAVSFKNPQFTTQVGTLGSVSLLDAVKNLNKRKEVKYYQASSSEMYGGAEQKKLMRNQSWIKSHCSFKVSAHQTKFMGNLMIYFV